MTLEQKLLQYFPYQPEFILSEIGIFNLDSEYGTPWQATKPMKLVGFTFDNGKIEINIHSDKYNWGAGYCELEEVRMVLHPLSDIFNRINPITEQSFIIEDLRKISDGCVAEEEWIDHIIDFGTPTKIMEVDFMQCPQRFVNYLRQRRYDLDGLIQDGFAVDINSIEH